MKIIGIFGKSGAGKTTLSKLIQSYDRENIEILHLDTIFDRIKKKAFKRDVIEQTDSDKNQILTVNPKLKNRLLKIKIIGDIIQSSTIRNMLGSIIIQRKISQARKTGRKAFIIEGIHLNDFKVIENSDVIIRIEAPFVTRLNRVSKRETKSVDKEKMVLLDKVFFKGKRSKYKYFIENNEDIEKLKGHAKQIYDTEIKNKRKANLLEERYGGYKVEIKKMPLVRKQQNKKISTRE